MILVDANLLVYAYASSSPEHGVARRWLDAQFVDGAQVGLAWESLNAFARLVSNPRVFPRATSVASAWDQVQRWLAVPSVWIPAPTRQHEAIMNELIGAADNANDVPDVHLAALAVSHGLRLATHDAGFARFGGLRWFDPLEAS